MIILKRFTPYWSSALVLLVFWYGLSNFDQWAFVALLLVLIPIVAIVIMRQPHWRMEYLGLTSASIILLLSAYTLILIQESLTLIYGIVAIATVFYFLFTKHLAVFLFQPANYVTYSLEHVSKYSNIVASFFLYVSLFIFYSLGIVRLRHLLAIMVVVTAVLVWQTLWVQKVQWAKSKWFVFAITLVMGEAFWALHFWPVSFFVSGAVLTISLYLLLHLTRLFLTQEITRKLAARYIITAAIATAALLITAQWVY